MNSVGSSQEYWDDFVTFIFMASIGLLVIYCAVWAWMDDINRRIYAQE